MEINLTKKEYRLLIDIFEIADWVLHSHRSDEPEETQSYRDIQQKFYALSQEMGADHLVRYDAELGEYSPTDEYEEESEYMSYVEDHEDALFWDELIARLAERDFIVQEGAEASSSMNLEEKVERLFQFEEKYAKEFEENGLKNLMILKESDDHK